MRNKIFGITAPQFVMGTCCFALIIQPLPWFVDLVARADDYDTMRLIYWNHYDLTRWLYWLIGLVIILGIYHLGMYAFARLENLLNRNPH